MVYVLPGNPSINVITPEMGASAGRAQRFIAVTRPARWVIAPGEGLPHFVTETADKTKLNKQHRIRETTGTCVFPEPSHSVVLKLRGDSRCAGGERAYCCDPPGTNDNQCAAGDLYNPFDDLTDGALVRRAGDKGKGPGAWSIPNNLFSLAQIIAYIIQRLSDIQGGHWTTEGDFILDRASHSLAAIGGAETRNAPNWAPAALIYRFRALMGQLAVAARSAGSGGNPVESWVNMFINRPFVDGADTIRQRIPEELRTVLINNQKAINNPNMVNDQQAEKIDKENPFSPKHQLQNDALIGWANNFGFSQGGSLGPFHLEAAIILAMQSAGFDIGRYMQNAMNRLTPAMRTVMVVPDDYSQKWQLFPDRNERRTPEQRCLPPNTHIVNGGADEAGIQILIQPTINSPDYLVIAIHTTDPESQVEYNTSPDANSNPHYSNFANVGSSSKMPAWRIPGATSFTRGSNIPRGRQRRIVAHVHAARVSRAEADGAIAAGRAPRYSQFGDFHFYVLADDGGEDQRPEQADN
ncbi:hypothetical protein HK104_011037 [Borealophlyctis nickersoniae]|nr:hypothetical protein HK104_011037 [Borealophlyctis nickersoniae]